MTALHFIVDVNVNLDLGPSILGLKTFLGDWLMTFDDALANLNTKLDAAVARIQADIDNLKGQGGTLSPEAQAKVDALQARIDAIDPDPNFPPVTPTPEPTPTPAP